MLWDILAFGLLTFPPYAFRFVPLFIFIPTLILLLAPGRQNRRLLLGWLTILTLTRYIGLPLEWFWPYTVLFLLHSVDHPRAPYRRILPWVILALSPATAILWFPVRVLVKRWGLRYPGIVWALFLFPLYRITTWLKPGFPTTPTPGILGILNILLLIFLSWLLIRFNPIPSTSCVIATVITLTGLTFFPNIMNARWLPTVWSLAVILTLGDAWIRLVKLPGGWQRSTAWANALTPLFLLSALGLWVHTGWATAFCDQPSLFVTGNHIRAQNFFPVSALSETRWAPGSPRVWPTPDGCYETMNLEGQLLTMVWQIQRKTDCHKPLTWYVTIANSQTGLMLDRFQLPVCLWPVTHPAYLTLSHLVPGVAPDHRFLRQRLKICPTIPRVGPNPILDLHLETIQRSVPLIYAQNIRVIRLTPHRFSFSVRLLNNRRSALQGTFLAGLIRPTPSPPFTWINVETLSTTIPSGHAIDIDWTLETHAWCGNATWGMAFYATSGERGYLWNGIL